MDRMKLWLLAGVPVVVAMAAARHSFDEASAGKSSLTQDLNAPMTMVSAPAAPPAKPKKAAPVAAAASKPASGVPPARSMGEKKTTSALNTTTAAPPPRREDTRRTAPPLRLASTTPVASKRESASGKPVDAPAYERRVADAASLGNEDLDRAARRLEAITMEEPTRPGAFETLAAMRLKQGDYYQAYEMFDAAIRNGGKATFSIMHNHGKGNFGTGRDATCVGALTLSPSQVTFEGADGHRFAASWSEMQDAGPNRFLGSRIGGFHVKLTASGRSQNFNLAPSSRDEREARILFDLLTANILRQDSAASQR